jgi:uncharacterized protein
MPGFVRVIGPSELAFPDYDGMACSKVWAIFSLISNIGILFIACTASRSGFASTARRLSDRDPLLGQTVGVQIIVRITARAISCLGYIATMELIEPSIYAPRASREAIEPAWWNFLDFRDYVHPRQPIFKG